MNQIPFKEWFFSSGPLLFKDFIVDRLMTHFLMEKYGKELLKNDKFNEVYYGEILGKIEEFLLICQEELDEVLDEELKIRM